MNSLPIGNFYINLKAEGLDLEKITSHITDKLGYKYIEVANGRAFWVPENRNLYHNSKDCTKHFIKQPEQGQTGIIEIDGKKYRKIDTQGKFENGDLITFDDNFPVTFIGYDNGQIVFADNLSYEAKKGKAFKLEEIKTRTLHYVIYKCTNEYITASVFYESKEDLEAFYPNVLEYRTFEEQL